jgi:hypothetical protein
MERKELRLDIEELEERIAPSLGPTGYEGQPGNQAGGGNNGPNGSTGNGPTGYEGQPGNQGG